MRAWTSLALASFVLVLRPPSAAAYFAAEEAMLTQSSPAAGDLAGHSVSITADGTRALVGIRGDTVGGVASTGSARVFVRSGASWTEEATLLAPTPAVNDYVGYAVSISADGTRALVGAAYTTWSAGMQAGRAYVFSRVGSTWTLEATLEHPMAAASDAFGAAVALSADGTRAVIGAPNDTSGSALNCGSTHVFLRSGAAWTLETTLAIPPLSNGFAGRSVSLSQDASRVIVAASGRALLFLRAGSTWSIETTLLAPAGSGGFASGVALSGDGLYALVGAFGEDQGSITNAGGAHVYRRTGSTWGAPVNLAAPSPSSGAGFGAAVSLDADGSRVLVGASGVSSAHVFVRSGTSWSADATLSPTGATAGESFGFSVALTPDGGRAIVGAPQHGTSPMTWVGSAHVFTLTQLGSPCVSGSACQFPFCVDGVCCGTPCGGGMLDCEACSVATGASADGMCTVFVPGTPCRPSAGGCDVQELCSGGFTCPPDVFAGIGIPCGTTAGPCDAPDVCTGTSAACPDTFRPAGTMCMGSTGVCDPADLCDGVTATCPAIVAPSTTLCRPSLGACDVEERCTGSSPGCPADAYMGAGTVCLGAGTGACDAPDVCTGTSADCMPTFVVGVECRASHGTCDLPESCTGADPECPPDFVSPAGTLCRAPTDPTCDALEACDGVATACPPDVTSCVMPDAGADAGHGDAGDRDSSRADAGAPAATTGCACRAGARSSGPGSTALLLLAVFVALGARPAGALRRRSR